MTQWTAFAHSMAAAFCSTMLVLAAMRGVIGRMVKVDGSPLPGLDVLRFSTGLNYALYNTGAMAALALSIMAMSIVVLRTHILGKWVGVVGIDPSAVILAAVAALLRIVDGPSGARLGGFDGRGVVEKTVECINETRGSRAAGDVLTCRCPDRTHMPMCRRVMPAYRLAPSMCDGSSRPPASCLISPRARAPMKPPSADVSANRRAGARTA